MRRIGLLVAVVVLGLATATMAWAQDDSAKPYGPGYGYGMGPGYGYGMGPGGRYGMGPGRGYGMGPGYGMHHGYGHFGGWGWGWGHRMGWVLSQLPADKQEQLRDFSFSMRRQLIAKRAELEEARLDLIQAMTKFPVDKQAAQSAYDHIAKARNEMFQLRLTALMQVQQIVGKELWEQMADGRYDAGSKAAPTTPGGPGGSMGPGRGMGH